MNKGPLPRHSEAEVFEAMDTAVLGVMSALMPIFEMNRAALGEETFMAIKVVLKQEARNFVAGVVCGAYDNAIEHLKNETKADEAIKPLIEAVRGSMKQGSCVACGAMLEAYARDHSTRWTCSGCKVDGATEAARAKGHGAP